MDLINIESTQRFNDIVESFLNNQNNSNLSNIIPIISINNSPYLNIMTRNVEDILNYSMLSSSSLEQIYARVFAESFEQEQDSVHIKKPFQILDIEFTPFKGGNKECSICKEKFKKDDIVSHIKCKHIFHKHCIMEWGKYKNECPNCREKLPLK